MLSPLSFNPFTKHVAMWRCCILSPGCIKPSVCGLSELRRATIGSASRWSSAKPMLPMPPHCPITIAATASVPCSLPALEHRRRRRQWCHFRVAMLSRWGPAGPVRLPTPRTPRVQGRRLRSRQAVPSGDPPRPQWLLAPLPRGGQHEVAA